MKNLLKIENIIFIMLLSILVFSISFEYSSKKEAYLDEKIYDLQLQYNAKLISNKELVNAILSGITEDTQLIKLVDEANKNINKDANRNFLLNKYKERYEKMKEQGVLQFHIHLANGESYLRLHKPKKYGDQLLGFRESVKNVIQTQKPSFGLEIGKYFEGFRYVFPLFYEGKYVGSMESSIKSEQLIKQLTESLDAHYSLIIKASLVNKVVDKLHIKNQFHPFCADKDYYMSNSVHDSKLLRNSNIASIKDTIQKNLKMGKPFVGITNDINNKTTLAVFIPIEDIGHKKAGYIFSIRDGSTIDEIFYSQLIKFIVAVLLLSLVFHFYRQGKQKTNTIEQLNRAIDRTTLVSKTDTKGKITYANDAFVALSGFTRKELLGKPHNIVRHEETPKEVFKEMWETIQHKKIWHGSLKNRIKDDGSYTVDATILPITDVNDDIIEYIAIRHDITELENYKELLKNQLVDTSKSLSETVNYTSQYEEAINSSTAILKTDTKNIITFANEQFCKVSGYSIEELVGINCETLRCEDHVQSGDCDQVSDRLSKRQIATIVFTNVDKNAKNYTIDTVIFPISDVHGDIIEHLHVMHDISEIVNLSHEIEETQREVVFRMGAIGETRSKETGNHVKRVAEYSKLLGTLYGLSKDDAELLKQASPMHDIGKVGIPDAVLNKPGSLDANEWKIMQTHSELGYEMLKHSERPILKAAATVANEHHEKWDGSGYPNGLEKEDIHIYGRITAVADVFDALGSDRCYKEAWPLEKILNLFKEESGKHFDPQLVEYFLSNLDQFLEIRDQFKD